LDNSTLGLTYTGGPYLSNLLVLVVLLPIAEVFKVISTVPIDFLLSSIFVIVRLKYFFIFLSGGSSSLMLLFNIPRFDAEAAGPALVCGLLSICFGIEDTLNVEIFPNKTIYFLAWVFLKRLLFEKMSSSCS